VGLTPGRLPRVSDGGKAKIKKKCPRMTNGPAGGMTLRSEQLSQEGPTRQEQAHPGL